jgi:hypothetical protein
MMKTHDVSRGKRRLEIAIGLVCSSVLLVLAGLWTDRATAQGSNIIWSADHEEGQLSDWYVDNGGGEFNSGNAVSTASTDVAHRGRYSVKATISAPPVSGVRLFRWTESLARQRAYYSAWYYFPRIHQAPWWNIFGFKSRPNTALESDPFWYVQVGNRPNGTMYLYLSWWPQLWPDRGVEGPHAGEFGGRDYRQTVKDLPAGQWVHIEAFLHQSAAFDGQIVVWQDGVEILNQSGVKTRYPAVGNEWSINNYTEAISPSPATIYVDDAVISTTRVGAGEKPKAPSNLRIIG